MKEMLKSYFLLFRIRSGFDLLSRRAWKMFLGTLNLTQVVIFSFTYLFIFPSDQSQTSLLITVRYVT